MVEANIYPVMLAVPIVLVLGTLYLLVWSDTMRVPALARSIGDSFGLGIMLALFIVGIIVHELLHGFVWALFSANKFKSIRFGIVWHVLTPYCHCVEPMTVRHYRLGAVAPCLVLGVAPSLMGIVSGHVGVFLYGVLFTIAAGGDLLILWALRKEHPETLVLDHPTRCGCAVFDPIDMSLVNQSEK
ncbi:MAG: DUF3267 domain-containing protein [bacterium]